MCFPVCIVTLELRQGLAIFKFIPLTLPLSPANAAEGGGEGNLFFLG